MLLPLSFYATLKAEQPFYGHPTKMSLSVKGKVRGKSKKSSIKESTKPSTVLSSEEISNVPSCIKSDDAPKGNIPKKDAVFFKGEHLAVRNAEGSFYLCQTLQQIYKTSKKIRIQWLSEKPESNPKKDIYIPEYYDRTEFETILTSVELDKHGKKMFKLPKEEEERIKNILKRAFDKESGLLNEKDVRLTEDNPDGLDISIYKDEDQLKELERRKRIEERKKSKKGRQKNNLGVNQSNSINDDTACKKSSQSTEGGKQECIDKDDEKPDLSTDKLSKTLKRARNSSDSKPTRGATKSNKDASLNKEIEIEEKPVTDVAKSPRKGLTRRFSDVVPAEKPSAPANAMNLKKKTSSADLKNKKADVDKSIVSAKFDKPNTKLESKIKNIQGNAKVVASTKTAQKPAKRKAEKEVFEFEDDFEEEVMPLPKKRAPPKIEEPKLEPVKDVETKTNNASTKGDIKKNKESAKSDDKKAVKKSTDVTESLADTPPEPSQRGRGRPKK
jgi:hypothetical protein